MRISAGAVLPNQLLGGGFKTMHCLLTGQGLEIGKGLATTLARIATTGLLQIAQSLLAQAAVMLPGALLKQLMQRIWHVANLQRGHCFALHPRCIHFIWCSVERALRTRRSSGQAIERSLIEAELPACHSAAALSVSRKPLTRDCFWYWVVVP